MTFSSVLGVCRQAIEHIETMGKQGLTVLIFPLLSFYLSFLLAFFFIIIYVKVFNELRILKYDDFLLNGPL